MEARIAGKVERHLGPNADDELFAKAMTFICDGYPPDCSYHHTCVHDGDCFKSCEKRDAARIVERVAKEQDGGVRKILVEAARMIRAGEITTGTVVQWQ